MPSYRLYSLDGAGRIMAADWLKADSDEAAIAAARVRSTALHYELWQGQRFVARVDGSGATSGDRS